jgi:hypothetical protein
MKGKRSEVSCPTFPRFQSAECRHEKVCGKKKLRTDGIVTPRTSRITTEPPAFEDSLKVLILDSSLYFHELVERNCLSAETFYNNVSSRRYPVRRSLPLYILIRN